MKHGSARLFWALSLLVLGIQQPAGAGTRYEAMVAGRDTLTRFQRHLGRYVRLYGSGGRLVASDAENFRIILYDLGSSLETSTSVKVIGTMGLPEDTKNFEQTGKERLNTQFSVAWLHDTLYVANVKSHELLRFSRDGAFLGSFPASMRVVDTDGHDLFGFATDSVFIWDRSTTSFTFKARFSGKAGYSPDENHPSVRLGPNRLAVRKDTSVALYDLSKVLNENLPEPLFTAHAQYTPEVGFTDSLFLWSTSYNGTYGACDLDGNNVIAGNIGIYNPTHNWIDGRFYGCSHSGERTMRADLTTISIVGRSLTYLSLIFLGADDANLYFYDGSYGGMLRAPLDDAHGQYVVSFATKVGPSAPISILRPATHHVYTLDSSPAATAPIRVYSFDSLVARQFNSEAAVAIGTIGDTVLALAGNRVYHYTPDGAMVGMITLATTDTTGHLGFTCSPTALFLASGTTIKVFNRDGSLARTHTFTLLGTNHIFMAGSSIFSNSPPAFISIGTGTVTTVTGVDWTWYFHQWKYWYGSARNTYSYWDLGITDVGQTTAGTPDVWGLEQNYPNPFNPSTTIAVHCAARGPVRLAVYDMLGREVAVLLNGVVAAGDHEVRFDATGLASGSYFARLTTNGGNVTKQMLLIR